jgi:hypothetical protein
MHVGADPEVPADQQAFALGDLPLVEVVGDAILQARIVNSDRAAVSCQVEVEQPSPAAEAPRRGERNGAAGPSSSNSD